uniref:Uncharacterized protein n=1 Tax=Panagrellus redivivus TaxID=6233 RepID=A0A7E4VK58_PANRE
MNPEIVIISQIDINESRHFKKIKDNRGYLCNYCLNATFIEHQKDAMLQHLRRKHPVHARQFTPNHQNKENQNGEAAVAVKNEGVNMDVDEAPDANPDVDDPEMNVGQVDEEQDAPDDDEGEDVEEEETEEATDGSTENAEETYDDYEAKLLRSDYTFVQQFNSLDALDQYRNDHGFNVHSRRKGIEYKCKSYGRTECTMIARALPNLRFYQKGNHIIECPFSQLQRKRSRAGSCAPPRSNPKRALSRARSLIPDNFVPRRGRSRAPSSSLIPPCSRSGTPNAPSVTGKTRNKQQLVTNKKMTLLQHAWLRKIGNQYQLVFEKIRGKDFVYHKGNARLDYIVTNEYVKIKTLNDDGGGEKPVKSSGTLKNCTWEQLLTKLDDKCKSLFSK